MALNHLAAAIAAAAARYPERPAFLSGDGGENWRSTLDRVARAAGGLNALGVQPGDRVALLAENGVSWIEAFLAIAWAGGIAVPLNTRWNIEELRFAIQDCEADLLLHSPAFDELVANLAGFGALKHVVRFGDDIPFVIMSYQALCRARPLALHQGCGTDVLGIFYTGGTTGQPKGVMISHQGLLSNARAVQQAGLFPDGCSTLHVAPLFHLAAAMAMVATCISAGAHVALPAFDPAVAVDIFAAGAVSDALLVPTMVQMILDHPDFEPAMLTPLNRLLYGASPMSPRTLARLCEAAPHLKLYQAYGMTELSSAATLLLPDDHQRGARVTGSVGRPIGGTEIRIVDAAGAPLPTGSTGEVTVRGPGVMKGYWRQSGLTADVLIDGWLRTGDGGLIDADGYLHIVDRLKDMIVTGGENVYSAEVEAALSSHPAVAQCAVIGIPDRKWGESVHAVVQLRAGAAALEEELIDHCRARISAYKCPRSVEASAAPLPASASGKVLKTELRTPFWKGQERNV